MKIHELELDSAKDRKRVGRGIGSGYGKTAGRGTKGQNARTGGGVRIGFAGGQNPLSKLLPKKRGFRALAHKTFQVVNISQLEQLSGEVTNATLAESGLIKKSDALVKILGQGEITKKIDITVQACSVTAKAAIERAGGSVTIVELPKSPKKATRPKTEETKQS